jgi:hypothetical protein
LLAAALASCAAPGDDLFRSAYDDDATAAAIGERLRGRLLEKLPPGQTDLYTAVRTLTQAGARCRPADPGGQRCTYTLLRPPGSSGGPLGGRRFVHFDVDLLAMGARLDDIQVLVN